MDMPSVGPIAAVIPVATASGAGSMSSDPLSLIMQLGMGGVLVAFAVWLQDKFTKAKDAQVQAERLLTQQRTDELVAEYRRRAEQAERDSQ